jgi:hypothetical protein
MYERLCDDPKPALTRYLSDAAPDRPSENNQQVQLIKRNQ